MTSIIQPGSVKPAHSSSRMRQWRLAIVILAASVALGVVAYPYVVTGSASMTLADYSTATVLQQDMQRTAQASGTVQIPNQMIVPAPAEGYTAELYVSVGDSVQKNDVIGVIEVPDLDESIEDLQAELLSAELSRQRTVLTFENSVENSEADITELQNDISELQADVEIYQNLVAINSARQSELEAYQDQLDDARVKLASAERTLTQAKSLHRIDLASADASIAQIETQLARALEDREEANIKSPMTGEVLEVADAMSVPGSSIVKGAELFTIADPDSAVFDLEISEDYADGIALGDQVPVTVGSSTRIGEISFVGKVAQTSTDGLGASIQVQVTPLDTSDSLLLGSTAIGVFTLGVEENALTLPRGSYLTTGSQKYVYVIEGNQAIKTQVTYGEIEGNTVQISSGLSAGDRVITSSYQNFISETTVTLGE